MGPRRGSPIRLAPVLFGLLLLAPAAAAACTDAYERYPAWVRLPEGGRTLDAVWTGHDLLVAYRQDDVVRLLRLDADEPRVSEGPYWPFPFDDDAGRLVAAGDRVLAVGAAGDKIVEIDPVAGTTLVWNETLPRKVRFAPVAYDGERAYVLGGLHVEGDAPPAGCTRDADASEAEPVDCDEAVAAYVGSFLTDAIVSLDPRNRTVATLDAKLPGSMWGGGAVAAGGLVHLAGGKGANGASPCPYVCDDVVVVDPRGGDVRVLETDLREGVMSGDARAAWIDGRLVVAPIADSLHDVKGRLVAIDPQDGRARVTDGHALRETALAAWVPGATLWFGAWSPGWEGAAARAVERTPEQGERPEIRLDLESVGRDVRANVLVQDPERKAGDGRPRAPAKVLVDWGDCATGPASLGHEYAASGTYGVTAYAVGATGLVGTASATVSVNTPPRLRSDAIADGLLVRLLAVEATDPDPGDSVEIRVDWGDGSQGGRRHAYAAPGAYAVEIVAEDRFGATVRQVHQVNVWSTAAAAPVEREETPLPSPAPIAALAGAALALALARRRAP